LKSAYELLSVSRRADKDDDIPGVLNSLGEVKREQARLEEARAYFILAWKVSRARGSRQNVADCFERLGELCIDLGRAGRARRWFERELACASALNDLSLKAGAKRGLARAWASEGRADVALPLAREALDIYSQLGHEEAAGTAALVTALAGGDDEETSL
jgi:tetratricopeptide (TPR) repeat protein